MAENRTCQAYVPFFRAECGEIWPEEETRRIRRACVHEHIRDGWACDLHLESVANGGCRTCFELDGHECPITLVPITEATP